LEIDVKGIPCEISKELRHSSNLYDSILINIKVIPGGSEMFIHKSSSFISFVMAIIQQNFIADIPSTLLVKEKVTSWFSIFVLKLDGIIVN